MTPRTRLLWCGVIIIGSAVYGVLVSINPRIATAIMVGYIALMMTILVAVNIWKGPPNE